MPDPLPTPLDSATSSRQQLTLLDSTCIIVGIIIGASIYEGTPFIAKNAATAVLDLATRGQVAWNLPPFSPATQDAIGLAGILGVWVAGGLLALVGAMCYAELATTWPHAGGSYFFLTRAFGKTVGFAFAWCEFWIIRPGNVGAISLVFARYAAKLYPGGLSEQGSVLLAAGAIATLTVTNLLGLKFGKWTQNILTLLKIAGLGVVVLVGLTLPTPAPMDTASAPHEAGSLGLALIMVMFAYGGWSDMSYVAAEVKNPGRNISRALLLGTLAVLGIYLLTNLAFARGLGLERFFSSGGVASDVLATRFGPLGAKGISLLICVSCLGAVNGMIFTGARVCYALGAEDSLFAWLGKWNERLGVPVRSLLVQAAVTIGLVLGFGLRFPAKGELALAATSRAGGFDKLVVFTSPFFWGFFVLVGLALVVLRDREPERERLFRLPLFPIFPAIFCLSSGYMMFASVDYVSRNLAWQALWAVFVIISGFLLAWLRRR